MDRRSLQLSVCAGETGLAAADSGDLVLRTLERCRMVWPVSRGRPGGVGFIFAVALFSRAAVGAESAIAVRCDELSSEGGAQIEARVRANLLSAGRTPTDITLTCDASSVRAQIRGSGREVFVRSERGPTPLEEALLASADAALAGWDSEPSSTRLPAPVLPAPPAPAPLPASKQSTVAEAEPMQRPVVSRPAVRPSLTGTWFFAGMRAEPWRDGSGLGAQLGAEHRFGAGFASVQGAYLFAVPSADSFSAREVQFGAQLGWHPPSLFGLGGAFGLGLSVFGAKPAPGVSAPGGSTSSASPFLSVEASRPIEFGAFAVVPVLGLRAFPASRAVLINGQPALTLPAVAFAASLNFALRAGG